MTQTLGDDDTIVATATAPGVGALAIVRVSGPGAQAIAATLMGGSPLPGARTVAVRRLSSLGGDALDEAIVLRYDAPRSYTGEDAIEIICHGGWVTATRITRALVEAGARPADPGEFTRRAVLNGRLDLLQAEAVNDLIRSESSAGAQLALRQLDGGLSRRLNALRSDVLDLEALMAYDIDFPEEDDGPVDRSRVTAAIAAALDAMDRLIASTPGGELVRHGALVAIVGPPNVGKSSLFNALLGRKRALVTNVPGTTRDAIEAVLDVSPVPLRLVDTAGMRETTDEVERLGVEVSREYLESATAVLACGDSPDTLAAALSAATQHSRGRIIPVRTKADLMSDVRSAFDGASLAVSATTGEGLETLLGHVSTLIARDVQLPAADAPIVSHARHKRVLEEARNELAEFARAWEEEAMPVTVIAVHLRAAVRLLEELIGTVDVEEILGRLFSAFCVGK